MTRTEHSNSNFINEMINNFMLIYENTNLLKTINKSSLILVKNANSLIIKELKRKK